MTNNKTATNPYYSISNKISVSCGDRAGRPTTLALISFIKDVLYSLEQHQPSAGVFCDLKE